MRHGAGWWPASPRRCSSPLLFAGPSVEASQQGVVKKARIASSKLPIGRRAASRTVIVGSAPTAVPGGGKHFGLTKVLTVRAADRVWPRFTARSFETPDLEGPRGETTTKCSAGFAVSGPLHDSSRTLTRSPAGRWRPCPRANGASAPEVVPLAVPAHHRDNGMRRNSGFRARYVPFDRCAHAL